MRGITHTERVFLDECALGEDREATPAEITTGAALTAAGYVREVVEAVTSEGEYVFWELTEAGERARRIDIAAATKRSGARKRDAEERRSRRRASPFTCDRTGGRERREGLFRRGFAAAKGGEGDVGASPKTLGGPPMRSRCALRETRSQYGKPGMGIPVSLNTPRMVPVPMAVM